LKYEYVFVSKNYIPNYIYMTATILHCICFDSISCSLTLTALVSLFCIRFLKRDPVSSIWEDVNDKLAREKASQVLRDAVAEQQQQQGERLWPNVNANANNGTEESSSVIQQDANNNNNDYRCCSSNNNNNQKDPTRASSEQLLFAAFEGEQDPNKTSQLERSSALPPRSPSSSTKTKTTKLLAEKKKLSRKRAASASANTTAAPKKRPNNINSNNNKMDEATLAARVLEQLCRARPDEQQSDNINAANANAVDDDNDEPLPKKTKIQRSFQEHVQALVAYKEIHGHCNVPQKWKENPSLGRWVEKVRVGIIDQTKEQRNQLNDLGFDWEAQQEKNDRSWNENFVKFQAQQQRVAVDDSRSPIVSVLKEQDAQLGNWVMTQRRKYHDETLRSDRKLKLETIGFVWKVRKAYVYDTVLLDRKWHQNYQKLVEFHKKHGHSLVPKHYEEDRSLGAWVCRQRDSHTNNMLRPDRKCLLDTLGFVLRVDQQKNWDAMFERLFQFKEKHGHLNVAQTSPYVELGRWVSHQRQRKNKMNAERRQKLDDVGFIWRTESKQTQKTNSVSVNDLWCLV
jgi:hypothetical protein